MLLALAAQAQTGALATVNLEQKSILRVGMLVLGGWAILNILLASFKLTTTTRSPKYFYQMNLYWNIVNLIIAGIALHNIISLNEAAMDVVESIQQHVWYKKVLYLNVGLDVAYLLLGAYLKQRSQTAHLRPERLMGWGRSIFLQGFFLLLLDVVLVVMLENLASDFFRLIP
ncbi:hypothetical protein H8S84_07590 [Pontibacter sp. SD6]|uniref:Uncharacterized protein n=1 Tax=Pontibacter cellulosilyticus TaxID=1720253 RepID=A0A923SIF5_9BACT|nr:hypothetical protein [Pontibacter cellulosilyticus]